MAHAKELHEICDLINQVVWARNCITFFGIISSQGSSSPFCSGFPLIGPCRVHNYRKQSWKTFFKIALADCHDVSRSNNSGVGNPRFSKNPKMMGPRGFGHLRINILAVLRRVLQQGAHNLKTRWVA